MAEDIEVRIVYYSGLILTSEMIKAQRFQIEMEQHYRDEREKHEDRVLALTLQTELLKNKSRLIFSLIPLVSLLLIVLWMCLK